jgi:hypothetical protein
MAGLDDGAWEPSERDLELLLGERRRNGQKQVTRSCSICWRVRWTANNRKAALKRKAQQRDA